MKTYVVAPHKNRLDEMVRMMGNNICFKGVIWKTIPKLSLLPLLICPGRVAQSVGHLTHKSEVLGSIPGLATHFCFSFR